MSATDALTITSALDALTRYYDAKEREENAVLYINDAYLEALNSLEKLEAENAKLRKYVAWLEKWALDHASFGLSADVQFELDMKRRELGVEVRSSDE